MASEPSVRRVPLANAAAVALGPLLLRIAVRLFYALWPDAAVQTTLGEWGHACHALCGGRRVSTEKLHVTVAFLGEIAEARYAALMDIGAAVGAGAFELMFDRVGYWRHGGIVYAAPRATPQALAILTQDLAQRLAAAGLRTEERAFAPHVTLLRDAKRPPRAVAPPALEWRVGALSLVETVHRDGKPAYRVRECWTLAR